MGTSPVVVAFADSPRVRETLRVLLEHDCDLRSMSPDGVGPADSLVADLALVATKRDAPLLQLLGRRWPTLPVVRVNLIPAAPRPPAAARVADVPLDPHAIRAAVLRHLGGAPEGALRATIGRLLAALRGEVDYAFAVLRTLGTLQKARAAAPAYGILGTVIAEQSYVLHRTLEQIVSFQHRPRAVRSSSGFLAALAQHLEAAPPPSERGVLCACTVDRSRTWPSGPLILAPLLGRFLQSHLRRHAATAAVRGHAGAAGLTLRYPRRDAPGGRESWPLLLATLLLEPWSWRITCHLEPSLEVVTVEPVSYR